MGPIDVARLDELLAEYPGAYFKENCTFANPYILTFTGGLPCSGNGECTPEGLCICKDGFRGLSDLFDLRGIACHNMLIVEQVFWLLMAFAMFVVLLAHIKAVKLKTETLLNKFRGEKEGRVPCGRFMHAAVRYFPYKVLLPFCIIGSPAFICLGVLRSFNNDLSIGNDVLPTVLLLLGSFPGFFSQQESGLEQFNHVAKGSLLRSEEGQRAKRAFKRVVRGGNLLYTLGKIPLVAYLFLPNKPFNPVVYPMIVVNNMLVAVYLIFFATGADNVYKKLSQLRSTMKTSQGANNTATSENGAAARPAMHGKSRTKTSKNAVSSQRLEQVLNFMHERSDSSRKAGFIGTLVYTVFSLPWFIGYQTCMYPLIILLSTKPNLAHAHTFSVGTRTYQSTQDNKATGGTTDVNQTKEETMTSYADSFMVNASVASIHGDGEERKAKVSVAEFLELESDDDEEMQVPQDAMPGSSFTAQDIIDDAI